MTISVFLRCLITLGFVVLVVVLSVIPGKSQTDDSIFVWLIASTPTLVQKLMHVVIYAALVFLWAWTLEHIESQLIRLVTAFALATSLGVALEWYQTTIPGRYGTLLDVLLNGLGAVAGVIAAILLL